MDINLSCSSEGIALSKRGAGIFLIGIAALLISSEYITIALFASNTTTWSPEFFEIVKGSVGNLLKNLSIFSLLVGILYLLLAEVESIIKFIKK